MKKIVVLLLFSCLFMSSMAEPVNLISLVTQYQKDIESLSKNAKRYPDLCIVPWGDNKVLNIIFNEAELFFDFSDETVCLFIKEPNKCECLFVYDKNKEVGHLYVSDDLGNTQIRGGRYSLMNEEQAQHFTELLHSYLMQIHELKIKQAP